LPIGRKVRAYCASYLHEGGHVQSRRDGIAAQIWATRAFFDDRLALGVGAGDPICRFKAGFGVRF
jgi:hypothetical protein